MAMLVCAAFASVCQGMMLMGLPSLCYPEAEPANKLASSRAKAMKAKVKNPFPLVDMADFSPTQLEASHIWLVKCNVRCVCLPIGIRKRRWPVPIAAKKPGQP